MEQFRSEGYFRVAQESAKQKGKEAKELESDEVVLDAAFRKAMETETDQIQMEDFVSVYGEEKIRADQKKVQDLHKEFERRDVVQEMMETRRLGKILEAIVTEQIELNEWLGPNVRTQQTAEFDDYTNGIDFVAEFDEQGALRHMGFAIDATHGQQSAIEHKLEKIRHQLNRGELGELTYFQTVDGSFQGKKRFIPRVVLAVDKKHMIELARLWVHGEQKALSTHPIKQQIMKEIIVQLQGQINYAKALEKKGKEVTNMIGVLSGQLAVMERLSESERARQNTFREIDMGAEDVADSVRIIFDPKHVERMREMELDYEITEGKHNLLDVSALQAERQELSSKRVEIEKREKTLDLEKKYGAIPRAALQQRMHYLLGIVRKGDKNAGKELGEIGDELGRRNALKKQEQENPHTELNERYQALLQQLKGGDKTVKAEIQFLEEEFHRQNLLNHTKDVLEKRQT